MRFTKMYPMGLRLVAFSVFFLLVVLFENHGNGQEARQQKSGPAIQITEAPECGAGPGVTKRIAGVVSQAAPAEHKVVIYSRTDKWYVQPYVANPYTNIGGDGTWMTNIHLGYEYAALLVKPSHKPPATTLSLPEVGGEILAKDQIYCTKSK